MKNGFLIFILTMATCLCLMEIKKYFYRQNLIYKIQELKKPIEYQLFINS